MIRLRGFSVECGAPISDADWWLLAAGLAEGVIAANRSWMRGREFGDLDLVACGVAYRPTRPVRSRNGALLLLPIRLAPAVLHEREGSCLDLSAFVVARERERGSVGAVRIDVDPITLEAHAVAVIRGQVWDPFSLGVPL